MEFAIGKRRKTLRPFGMLMRRNCLSGPNGKFPYTTASIHPFSAPEHAFGEGLGNQMAKNEFLASLRARFAVFPRGAAEVCLKVGGEGTLFAEAAKEGNVGDAVIALAQEAGRAL